MKKTKIWDLPVRLSHLAMSVLVLGAFLTAEEDDTIPLHTRLGLVLLGVVLFRVVWGFVGSKHARFTDFVKSPREVVAAARAMVRGTPGEHPGHNPVGGVMVMTLLATLATVTVTGIVIALGPEWGGPLAPMLSKGGAHAIKEVHEAAAWLLPVLVAFHVAGVLLSSVLEKQNLVLGMVTGFKRTPASEPDAPPTTFARGAGFVTAALLGLAAVLAVWKLLPVGTAEAAPALLAGYEATARKEDPGFKGFDAARGKTLYFEEHDGKNGKVSCATCHTADARKEGKSPVGKLIDPLAPSANPQALTDQAKADKWFDRNCKQVLGRTCTARERGDFVTYLTTL
jgi:cytochrome b